MASEIPTSPKLQLSSENGGPEKKRERSEAEDASNEKGGNSETSIKKQRSLPIIQVNHLPRLVLLYSYGNEPHLLLMKVNQTFSHSTTVSFVSFHRRLPTRKVISRSGSVKICRSTPCWSTCFVRKRCRIPKGMSTNSSMVSTPLRESICTTSSRYFSFCVSELDTTDHLIFLPTTARLPLKAPIYKRCFFILW